MGTCYVGKQILTIKIKVRITEKCHPGKYLGFRELPAPCSNDYSVDGLTDLVNSREW